MHASLFSLVVADDPDQVFAWGMEIASDGRQDDELTRTAILYIGSPDDKGRISTHASAEAACKRWSMVVPLTLVWDAEAWADAHRSLDELHAQAQS